MVDAQDVHKYFHNNEVLRGVSMQVQQGEVVVIIGPSGSGKTTFLRCINHLEKINGGRIYVDGELIGYRERRTASSYEIPSEKIAPQRREIGMVFQRFNLFPHLTALQNIIEAPMQVKGVAARAGRGARAGAAERGGAGRQGRRLSRAPLRRPAAARRHCARAGDGPQADAVRRGDLRAGPRAGRRGAGGDASLPLKA